VIFQRSHPELNEFLDKHAFTLFELFVDFSEFGKFELSTFVNGFAFLTNCLVQKLKTRQAVFPMEQAFEMYIDVLQKVIHLSLYIK
jgi:hypothetical protein